uniref:Uncharacterized protein n=1 Tax=Plectus sambesii TaxID=2011161 RepID=A0A914W9B4_9BILA
MGGGSVSIDLCTNRLSDVVIAPRRPVVNDDNDAQANAVGNTPCAGRARAYKRGRAGDASWFAQPVSRTSVGIRICCAPRTARRSLSTLRPRPTPQFIAFVANAAIALVRPPPRRPTNRTPSRRVRIPGAPCRAVRRRCSQPRSLSLPIGCLSSVGAAASTCLSPLDSCRRTSSCAVHLTVCHSH